MNRLWGGATSPDVQDVADRLLGIGKVSNPRELRLPFNDEMQT
jgi:hypothetical protein